MGRVLVCRSKRKGKEEVSSEKTASRADNVRSFAAGMLLARALPAAAIQGGWLMTAAIGAETGGLFAAAVFAAACALFTMLWEGCSREEGRGKLVAAAVVLYALSVGVQCSVFVHRGHWTGVFAGLPDCIVMSLILWQGHITKSKRVWSCIAAAAIFIVSALTAERLGIPCDGKAAALLIELSGAAAAGRALVLAKEGIKPEWAALGAAAAMVLWLMLW